MKADQMDLPLDRSTRRQEAAVRRDRRAVGLHPDPWGKRVATACGRVTRSRALQLGLLWSLALSTGIAGGLWLAQEGLPVGPGAPQLQIAAQIAAELPPPAAAPAPRAEIVVAGLPGGEMAGASAALPAAPAPTAETATATVPVAPQAQPAWLANAVPSAIDPDRPMIAVVIDDLGLRRQATRDAAALPAPLSLAFLAYAPDLETQAAAARAAGHELLLHQPMEPQGAQDPGPGALLTGLSAQANVARLTAALDRLPGVVGINNHMGSRFTASPAALEPVLRALKRRGLLFLDSRTTSDSVALPTARKLGLPSVGRDVFLDHRVEAGRPYVERQLAALEAMARQTGAAVAIGHPHAGTLEALRAWLPTLEARGLQLVPISALVQARQSRQLAEAERR